MVFSGVTIGVVAPVPLYAASRYGIGALDAGALLVVEGVAATIMSIATALVLLGADVATIPPATIRALARHPLTDKGLKAFLTDWKKTGQTIA